MTRIDMLDWLQSHGCTVMPEEGLNNTANVVKVVNASNGRYSYISTPINQKVERRAAVKRICLTLGVPIPNYALQEDEE